MNWFRKLVSMVVLALTAGYPAMACVSSAQEMTNAERECCKQMAQHCGSMEMPASHSCCRIEVRQPQSMLLAASTHVAPPVGAYGVTADVPKQLRTETGASFFQLHPVAESPPGSSSILRI